MRNRIASETLIGILGLSLVALPLLSDALAGIDDPCPACHSPVEVPSDSQFEAGSSMLHIAADDEQLEEALLEVVWSDGEVAYVLLDAEPSDCLELDVEDLDQVEEMGIWFVDPVDQSEVYEPVEIVP